MGVLYIDPENCRFNKNIENSFFSKKKANFIENEEMYKKFWKMLEKTLKAINHKIES